jgi:hypothetical protein
MYKLLKDTHPSIQTPLVKSLFAGMVSSEYPPIRGNSFFEFSFSKNIGISLVRAVVEQDIPMVQALLDAGFHPDIRVTSKKDEPKGKNSTPLMFAAQKGDKEIVEELLSKGATVNAQNELGETAEQIARKAGHDEIASLLSLSKKCLADLSIKKKEQTDQIFQNSNMLDILESSLANDDVKLSPNITICDSCGGNGAVRCPQCRGVNEKCGFCKGTGNVDCFLCKGTGYKN